MRSKSIDCQKITQKGKNFSKFLETAKRCSKRRKLPSSIGTGLVIDLEKICGFKWPEQKDKRTG